jgi:hypothetical protein
VSNLLRTFAIEDKGREYIPFDCFLESVNGDDYEILSLNTSLKPCQLVFGHDMIRDS